MPSRKRLTGFLRKVIGKRREENDREQSSIRDTDSHHSIGTEQTEDSALAVAGSAVGSSVDPPDYEIPVEDTDGYQPWYVVRKPGLSPICSICEVMLGRFGTPGTTEFGDTILTTAVPVQERAMAGCDLCSLFIGSFEQNNSVDEMTNTKPNNSVDEMARVLYQYIKGYFYGIRLLVRESLQNVRDWSSVSYVEFQSFSGEAAYEVPSSTVVEPSYKSLLRTCHFLEMVEAFLYDCLNFVPAMIGTSSLLAYEDLIKPHFKNVSFILIKSLIISTFS
jgi:hypothetical protein